MDIYVVPSSLAGNSAVEESIFDLGTPSDDIRAHSWLRFAIDKPGTFRPNAAYNAPQAAAPLDDGTSFARIALRLKGASTP